MGKLSKRFLSLLVAAVMVLSMLPASVFASDYDVSTMTDQQVVDLCMQLEAEGNWEAIEAVAAQLDGDRLAAVNALYQEQQEHTPVVQAENTATVTAYKQVSYATSKVVDAKYFEAVGTATSLEAAVTMIGGSGGLIEISEGTLVVTNRQDITMPNIIIKGAGKNLTTITGDSSKFNNSTDGCGQLFGEPKTEYKTLLGLAQQNLKVMDLTVDAGDCGKALWMAAKDFKTVRINSGVAYLENVVIKGSKSYSNLMIGTSESAATVYAKNIEVQKAALYDTEIVSGSSVNADNSILGGSILGAVDNLGEGYYKIEYAGVVAYTTIPYAIECYENGTFSSSMMNEELVGSSTPVVEAMTNDLTTISTTGTPKLLYGYKCAEMYTLAAEFKTALLGLSSDAEVDANTYLKQLTAALAIENWHTVEADGTCSHCGTTGLEVPAPEVELEVPSVDEVVLPEDVTEDEKAVVEEVLEEIKQNTALEGFVPENLAEGSDLSIKLTGMEVKGDETIVPEKITYDVKPVDKDNNVTTPVGSVTFRLPIPASVTKPLASVYHNGTLMGTYPIKGAGNGKYIEVTTDSFSTFTVEMENAPDATVTVMKPILLSEAEHDYMVWPSNSGSETIDRPLQIVMNFKANETLEECVAGKFSKYLVDFYLKVEGLSGDTIITDGCYLAGNYGTFGWIVIPADGIEMEEGISYPIVSAYDATLNYKDICGSVKDFTAAIYISEAILTANPNFKVTLELRMTDPKDENNIIVVGEPATYTVDDLNAGLAYLGKYQEVKDEHIENIENVNTNTSIDGGAHDEVIEAAKDDLLDIFAPEKVETAVTDVVITFQKMEYVEDEAPARVSYKVTPVIRVGNYEQKISTFDAPVTFRLPVSADETCTEAKVYHEGELMGVYTIKEEDGVKFVEVSSKNFSTFTVEPVAEFDAVAQIGDVYYVTLKDAIDAAVEGDTVVLLSDVTLTETVIIDKKVTIEGSGKKIVAGSALQIALRVNAGGDLTLGEGLAVEAAGCAVFVRDGKLTTSANLTVTGELGAIQTNGSATADVTVNGGNLTAPDTTATIYWPSTGKLTITGGTITGGTAVYMKSGELEITGGKLVATGAKSDYVYDGNGCSVTGAALVIENIGGSTGYEEITSVSITGGTFESANSAAVASYTAGNEGVEAKTGFVSGGTFNTAVAEEYCAEGYVPVENEDGTYGVEEESIKFAGAALLFKDEIKIKFYLTVKDATASELSNAGIEIYTSADLSDTPTVLTKLVKNGSYYQITTAGIAAKDMGDLLYVRAYIEVDGEKVYTDVISYSPAVYCEYHIGEADKDESNAKKMAMAKLCIGLMNYGAKAQEYFAAKSDYTYTTLMNSFITAEQQAWLDGTAYDDAAAVKDVPAYDWTVNTEKIKLVGMRGVFKGALQMRLYAQAGVNGTVKLYYWTETTAGDQLLIENATEISDIALSGDYYNGYITSIAAKDTGSTVYMCATVTAGEETYYSQVIAYSMHKYAAVEIQNQSEMADLSEALVIYSNVAKEYMANYNPQE